MKPENIDLSVIIISFNTKEIIEDCIVSVLRNIKDIKYEIIVVDNNSTDGSVNYLKKLSYKKNVICRFLKENIGFGGANNIGMKLSRGNYILLLNSDCVVQNNVILKIKSWMDQNQKYGLVSPNLYNKDGTVQGTGGYFPSLLSVFSWMTIQDIPFVDLLIKPFHPLKGQSAFKNLKFYQQSRDLDWVTGAFFMLRRKAYEDVGYFDTDYFMYTEEVDYSYRLKEKGWLVKYLPYKGILHFGGASGVGGDSIVREFEGVKLFYRKHYQMWKYPVLRLLLKTGCLWRMIVFGLIKGKEAGKVYAKAFLTV